MEGGLTVTVQVGNNFPSKSLLFSKLSRFDDFLFVQFIDSHFADVFRVLPESPGFGSK